MISGKVMARKIFAQLEEMGLKYPYPLQRACEKLSIDIAFAPLGNCDGCYLRNKQNNRVLILINREAGAQRVSVYRQRFSLAHEIGHVVMDHPPMAFLGGIVIGERDPRHEIEANSFAAELLMPKKVLAAKGFMTPKEIKEFCRVSLEAAEIRSEQLGWSKRDSANT